MRSAIDFASACAIASIAVLCLGVILISSRDVLGSESFGLPAILSVLHFGEQGVQMQTMIANVLKGFF